MYNDVIIALIGFGSTVVTAALAYVKIKAERNKTLQAESELTMQATVLDFTAFMIEWGDVLEEIRDLMKETEIDRFLILRAWNGNRSPRWTTAVFQIRSGDQEHTNYIHFTLDADYVNKLRDLEDSGFRLYKVSDMDANSRIRAVYEAEGVTASLWSYLGHRDVGKNSRALAYCSFSTHVPSGEINKHTITKCKVLSDRIYGAVAGSTSSPLAP